MDKHFILNNLNKQNIAIIEGRYIANVYNDVQFNVFYLYF